MAHDNCYLVLGRGCLIIVLFVRPVQHRELRCPTVPQGQVHIGSDLQVAKAFKPMASTYSQNYLQLGRVGHMHVHY